jgi:hypothetical protein
MNQRSDRIQTQMATLMQALTDLTVQVTHQQSKKASNSSSICTKDSKRQAEESNQQSTMDDIPWSSKTGNKRNVDDSTINATNTHDKKVTQMSRITNDNHDESHIPTMTDLPGKQSNPIQKSGSFQSPEKKKVRTDQGEDDMSMSSDEITHYLRTNHAIIALTTHTPVMSESDSTSSSEEDSSIALAARYKKNAQGNASDT